MCSTIHRKLTVLPGGKIELVDVQLPSGLPVDVFVVVPSSEDTREGPSALDILDRAPGRRLFHSIEEVDAHVRSERASWES